MSMQHTYTKKLFIVYLKFQFHQMCCILPGNTTGNRVAITTDIVPALSSSFVATPASAAHKTEFPPGSSPWESLGEQSDRLLRSYHWGPIQQLPYSSEFKVLGDRAGVFLSLYPWALASTVPGTSRYSVQTSLMNEWAIVVGLIGNSMPNHARGP